MVPDDARLEALARLRGLEVSVYVCRETNDRAVMWITADTRAELASFMEAEALERIPRPKAEAHTIGYDLTAHYGELALAAGAAEVSPFQFVKRAVEARADERYDANPVRWDRAALAARIVAYVAGCALAGWLTFRVLLALL